MNAICGPAIVAQEREPERTSWCFRCRHITDHYLVVSYPERGSYYEPSADVRCCECGTIDGDVFPGMSRGWTWDTSAIDPRTDQ